MNFFTKYLLKAALVGAVLVSIAAGCGKQESSGPLNGLDTDPNGRPAPAGSTVNSPTK